MVKIVRGSQVETVSQAVSSKENGTKLKKRKDTKPSKVVLGTKTIWKGFIDRCRHYCTITSIHGWRHMVRNDFSKWER